MKKAFFGINQDGDGYMVPEYMKTRNREIYYANDAIDFWEDANVSCYKDNVKKQFLFGQWIAF